MKFPWKWWIGSSLSLVPWINCIVRSLTVHVSNLCILYIVLVLQTNFLNLIVLVLNPQKLFVIIMFSKHIVEQMVSLIGWVIYQLIFTTVLWEWKLLWVEKPKEGLIEMNILLHPPQDVIYLQCWVIHFKDFTLCVSAKFAYLCARRSLIFNRTWVMLNILDQ